MGISEAFVNAIKSIVGVGKDALAGEFGTIISDLAAFALATPVPLDSSTSIFTFSDPPSDTVWAALFPIYEDIQLFVIALFGLALGLTFTTGAIKSSAKTRKQIRRLAFYFPLAYWWWWIGGWFLQFNQVLTKSLIGGSYLTGLDGLLAVGLGSVLIVAVLYVFGFGAALAVGVVYIARWFVIHVYIVVMPILFSLRAFPFEPIQNFAGSLMTKFYPLVLTTVPVAILFRISAEILDASTRIGGASYITPIFAIMTLILAAILPKLTFQFSGQIQRSVRSASTVARGAAGQATTMASGGGAAQQTLGGETADPAAMGDSGGSAGSSTMSASSQSSRGSLRHEAELDFTRRGRRRRQMERGAKGVKAAAKAGKKTASAAKKGTLGAFGGAAKAHEKGKQSDMPTATAAAGSAAWQTGEAAKSKAEDIVGGASSSVRSNWEKRVKRRAKNARETGQSTVEQARQVARESDGLGSESESESNTPEADVDTAPGEPAISDSYEQSSWQAFDQLDDTGTVDTTGTADSGLAASRNDTGMVNAVNEQRAEEIANEFAEDIEAGNTAFESIDDVDVTDVRQAAHDYTDEYLGDNKSADMADRAVWDKFAEQNPEWSEKKRSPGDEINYTGSGGDRDQTTATDTEATPTSSSSGSPTDSGDESAADPSPGDLDQQPSTGGGSTTSDSGGDTTVGSVSQDRTYERNSSDTETGSFADSRSQDAGDPVDGLTDTEQAVQTHLETNGKSPDEVSHAALAGEMMGNDQIDDPGDVKDALDTLRNPDN